MNECLVEEMMRSAEWRSGAASLDAACTRSCLLPRLVNTDGEPMLFMTDHFEFAAGERDRVLAGLAAIEGGVVDEGRGGVTRIAFIRPGFGPHPGLADIVVGRVEIGTTRLEVETNSRPRADALRRRIEEALGALVHHRGRDHEAPEVRIRDVDHAPPAHSRPGLLRRCGM